MDLSSKLTQEGGNNCMTVNSIPISQIRLIIEYKSYPMWLCDEDGILVLEGIVDELKDDTWLCRELDEIQQIYNSLFIDTKIEFSYVGFSTKEEEQNYLLRLQNVSSYVAEHLDGKYAIRDSFPITDHFS